MKQKHYIAIAQAIKENTRYYESSTHVSIDGEFINALCDILKAENKNFDKTKFMEAVK